MKFVIDLQAAQSESRHRGIGRYASAIAKAFVELLTMDHEIWIVANAQLGHMENIRSQFDGLIPQDRIVSFSTTGSTIAQNASNIWRQKTSELVREDFLRGLEPDLVWTTSLFEGWVDDSFTGRDRELAEVFGVTDIVCADVDVLAISELAAHGK